MAPGRYEAIAALVARRFGIDLGRYSPSTIDLLLSTVPHLIEENDRAALERIISACSIGETMFLRHAEQFEALRAAAPSLPSARQGRPLRVWSAGCATGEEAYSLAAVLAGAGHGVRVLGTDVNAESIERARAGRYRPWSMRGVDSRAVDGWLRIDGLTIQVSEHLRPLVEFRVHNLVDGDFPSGLDVVFCRNVLLYFRADAALAVLRGIQEVLEPGGLLFLGHFDPEPEPSRAGWIEERIGQTRCFRRTGAAAEPRANSVSPPAGPCPAVAAPVSVLGTEVTPTDTAGDPLRDGLGLARALSGQRAFEDAFEVLRRLAAEHPLAVEPHVLTAMIADEAGAVTTALEAARRACFLAPEDPVVHFLLGSGLDHVGERRRAGIHWRLARTYLDGVEDASAPLEHGEGLSVRQLRRMIDACLTQCE